MSQRAIKKKFKAKTITDGAGVKLNRVFGYYEVPDFDPFLLLDHFKSTDPDDFMAGFPWHPHRGIETVTYMISGSVEHGDSIGNSGVIKSGEIQWMTAGSGVIHQEMPQNGAGGIEGFQLWVNLPSKDKMMDPRYQQYGSKEIPSYTENGATVKVIAGKYDGHVGPVQGIDASPLYLDVSLEKDAEHRLTITNEKNVFLYVYRGTITYAGENFDEKDLILLEEGNQVNVASSEGGCVLIIAGLTLNEPVAWRGPIVMNTDEELNTAFDEYNHDTFIKKDKDTVK